MFRRILLIMISAGLLAQPSPARAEDTPATQEKGAIIQDVIPPSEEANGKNPTGTDSSSAWAQQANTTLNAQNARNSAGSSQGNPGDIIQPGKPVDPGRPEVTLSESQLNYFLWLQYVQNYYGKPTVNPSGGTTYPNPDPLKPPVYITKDGTICITGPNPTGRGDITYHINTDGTIDSFTVDSNGNHTIGEKAPLPPPPSGKLE